MTHLPGRRSALLLGLGGVLTGCGFRPVYAPSGPGGGLAAEGGAAGDLAAVEVLPMYERPGQLLREALLARLRSEPGKPRRYELTAGFGITGEAVGILNLTQATRARLVGTVAWTLTARDSAKTRLTEGSERIVDGIDIFGAQLFGVDLDFEAAQRRMAMLLADKVVLALAVWFARHPSAAG